MCVEMNRLIPVITIKSVDLFITFAHRVSCSILQRAQEEDTEIDCEQMHNTAITQSKHNR